MLFHYHFWTPFIEKTEKFYESLGFKVTLRTGKYEGKFQAFHPPSIKFKYLQNTHVFSKFHKHLIVNSPETVDSI